MEFPRTSQKSVVTQIFELLAENWRKANGGVYEVFMGQVNWSQYTWPKPGAVCLIQEGEDALVENGEVTILTQVAVRVRIEEIENKHPGLVDNAVLDQIRADYATILRDARSTPREDSKTDCLILNFKNKRNVVTYDIDGHGVQGMLLRITIQF